jgi:hypothetical protein
MDGLRAWAIERAGCELGWPVIATLDGKDLQT